MSTEVQNPEEHTDQSLKIAGTKYYILKPEKTFKCHEDIIGKIPKIPGLEEVMSVEECDFLVVFCMIASRAGTDIEAALKELNKLSDSKTAIFMVLHHTFDREKTVPDSSRSVNRKNTLTLDFLFYESEGLLECMKNTEAFMKIDKCLPSQIQAGWFSFVYNFFSNMWQVISPYVKAPDAQAEEQKGETGDKQETTLFGADVLLEDKGTDPSEGQGTDVQSSMSTEVQNPGEHTDQSLKIAGNSLKITELLQKKG
ncbi:uncharacterized protein [Misgurnus anguillicaudatus]|uniref:uncharacterized protein n=1 Tax=Misgurnus anguillicaudatus TaxID=75329 RepID=UPI003CCF5F1E